jgi:hypothetical protein
MARRGLARRHGKAGLGGGCPSPAPNRRGKQGGSTCRGNHANREVRKAEGCPRLDRRRRHNHPHAQPGCFEQAFGNAVGNQVCFRVYPLASRTMKQASLSSADQGGGKLAAPVDLPLGCCASLALSIWQVARGRFCRSITLPAASTSAALATPQVRHRVAPSLPSRPSSQR